MNSIDKVLMYPEGLNIKKNYVYNKIATTYTSKTIIVTGKKKKKERDYS